MASVQRKLVHKQFNSPIGLYSDQNVKETLDRELRAFNGNVGIDLNDVSRAPLNLINSSVLKMVAEEDYEKTHPAPRHTTERQSRPRQRRPITREDVLKINRRAPRRRDVSWPPSDDRSRSRSSSEEIHFDERIRKRHEIFHLKEMFDQGTIEDATTANKRYKSVPSSTDQIGCRQDVRSPDGNRSNEKRVEFNVECQSAKRRSRPRYRQPEWPPRSHSADNESSNAVLSKKSFYLPENELHIGNIEPIRAYWHHISARSSSSPSPRSCSPAQYGGVELKRWRSQDNIASASCRTSESPCSSRLAAQAERNPHKKDNLPLERNKSNSYNELPPLKPRREDRKSVQHTKKKLNLNNSKQLVRKLWDAGCWVSDAGAKLNEEQKQPQGQDSSRGMQAEENIKYALSGAAEGQKGQINEEHQDFTTNNNQNHSQQSERTTIQSAAGYGQSNSTNLDGHSNISKELRPSVAPSEIGIDSKSSSTMDLRALQSHPMQEAYFKMMKDQVQLQEDNYNSCYQKHYSQQVPLNNQRLHQETSNPYTPHKDNDYFWDFNKDMPFDRGASSQSSNRPACKANELAEMLLLKRCLVEEAITQDIQRIGEYMKRAEQEALTSGRYANESIAITPLQAILKQIVMPQSFALESDFARTMATTTPVSKIAHFDPAAIAMVMQVENMPVVDEALLELLAVSRTLEAFDGTSHSGASNLYASKAHLTELQDNEAGGDAQIFNSSCLNPVEIPRKGSQSDQELESIPGVEPEEIDSLTDSQASRTESGTPVVKIIHSKNILSGYLIAKQSQEDILKNVCVTETDTDTSANIEDSEASLVYSPPIETLPTTSINTAHMDQFSNEYLSRSQLEKCDMEAGSTDQPQSEAASELALHIKDMHKELSNSNRYVEKDVSPSEANMEAAEHSDCIRPTDTPLKLSQQNNLKARTVTSELLSHHESSISIKAVSNEPSSQSDSLQMKYSSTRDQPDTYSITPGESLNPNQNIESCLPSAPWRRARRPYFQNESSVPPSDKLEKTKITAPSKSADACNYPLPPSSQDSVVHIQEDSDGQFMEGHINQHRSRCRTRLNLNSDNRFRSSSQPSSQPKYPLPPSPLVRQHSLDSSESRFFASPRLYMSGHFGPGKGYKRVAWPPVDTAPVYATVPQPQNPPPSAYEVSSQARQKSEPSNYYQQSQYQQQQQSKSLQQQSQYQQKQYQQPQSNYQSHSFSQPQVYYQSQYQQPQAQRQQSQHQPQRYETSPARQNQLNPHTQQSYGSSPASGQGSTVSFAGGIARSVSPSRPIAREYIPGHDNTPRYTPGRYQEPEQVRQPEQYLQSEQYRQPEQHQPSNHYQQPQYQQPMQSQLSALNGYESCAPQSGVNYASPPQSSYPGWSHVRPPTPSRTGYTLQGNYPQYQRTNSASRGSEPPYGAYQSSQNEYQPQATQAFQPVNQQPSAQGYQAQSYSPQQQQHQPQYQQPQQQQQQQQYYAQPQRQASPYVRGHSPGVIQLRKEPPISQRPAPVYTSQPATATLQGGSNMRGDLKWPPPEYKAQAAVANEERRRIAQGPVCRPRRVQKDYSSFFAKNALNHYYPGYKIPPGTQHMYTQY